jgi:hypothetical protein
MVEGAFPNTAGTRTQWSREGEQARWRPRLTAFNLKASPRCRFAADAVTVDCRRNHLLQLTAASAPRARCSRHPIPHDWPSARVPGRAPRLRLQQLRCEAAVEIDP